MSPPPPIKFLFCFALLVFYQKFKSGLRSYTPDQGSDGADGHTDGRMGGRTYGRTHDIDIIPRGRD